MKTKTGKITFLLLTLLSLIGPVKAEPLIMEASVTADVLNVRLEPSTESSIISSLKKGTRIKITGCNSNQSWFSVSIGEKNGWVSKNFIQTSITGNINYETVSSIGSLKKSGVLSNPFKITTNNHFKYVLERKGKFELKVFDDKNDYLKSFDLDYPWVNNENEKKLIVLAADNKMNFYTNSEKRNVICKYDINGNKIGEIKDESINNIVEINYENSENLLYVLDASKFLMAFDKNDTSVKNILLSETRIPKAFSVSENKIFVLDYPENEKDFYPVYYVTSYSFGLKSNYDSSSQVIENLSKGSIIKFDSSSKNYKTKILDNNDPSKVREVNWTEIDSGITKLYADTEEIKKVNIIGEIDIYKTSGDPENTITLNKKWILKNPDRHRESISGEIKRKLTGIMAYTGNLLIIPVFSEIKNSSFRSLNYYYLDLRNDSYKVSQSIPFTENKYSDFSVGSNQEVFSLNPKGSFDVIDENGLIREKLGRLSPLRFNIPEQISIKDNRLFVFDRGNSSLGEYDLNGDPVKVKINEPQTDLFEMEDVYFSDKSFLILKTLQAEEKKLGIEIFDYNFKKLFDRWLISLESNSTPEVSTNDRNEFMIAANGTYFGKKTFLSMFNDKGHLINKWVEEKDLYSLFSEADKDNFRPNNLKFIGFDNKSNVYFFINTSTMQNKIICMSISTDGRAKLLKTFDTNFFGETTLADNGKEKVEVHILDKFFIGKVINIVETTNGFTYFLYEESISGLMRIGIFDPTGAFWKEFSLKGYPKTRFFSLDSHENIWISDGTSIQKLSNSK